MKRGQEAEYFTRLFFNCKETQYKIIPELGFLYRQHEDTKSSKNTIYNKGYKESLFYFLLENFKRAEQLKSKELLDFFYDKLIKLIVYLIYRLKQILALRQFVYLQFHRL